ncbi:hypothetical protein [Bradyrhizobium canariense]|uniref:Uncharacterized protein n=1 Tax=Bradyrhizobium canariense TaxID=255045 RepID=A0A1H2ADS9_9BRAD|nr:hypothetical protein [Bradyrhizobium canariense]SDT44141.1 hypothetical protein SAMN05444158_6084 [Bradyrhizobium canariense]
MIALLFLLFPVLVGALARSRGRSFVRWFILSVGITPIGGLILLLILMTRERRSIADKLNKNGSGITGQRKAEAARGTELDEQLRAEARDKRVERLIAERMRELANAPVPSMASPSPSSTAGPPVFGKRR